MKEKARQCPECDGQRLYEASARTSAPAASLWPRLGGLWGALELRTVVCVDCGFTRFYAGRSGRERMLQLDRWRRV